MKRPRQKAGPIAARLKPMRAGSAAFIRIPAGVHLGKGVVRAALCAAALRGRPALLLCRALHALDDRLFQVDREEAQDEKEDERDQDIQAGEQPDVVEHELMEEVDAYAGANRDHGEHIDERGKIHVRDAAAARALVLALALELPRADQIDALAAIRARRDTKILQKMGFLS